MIASMTDEICIAAADHPSLEGDIDTFLGRLHAEQRYFGPSARSNPKPSRSLIASLHGRGGFRLAAVECGQIIGLARVDGAGELFMAVDAEHRSRGIGSELGRAVAQRARQLHYTRIVLRSTQRSQAIRRIGEELGCIVVDGHRGRTDFILDLLPAEQIA
jgi:GNAT superfamily N-acetyltransferase